MARLPSLSILTNARGMLGAPATWVALNVMIIALALSLKVQILCPLARLNTKHLPKLSSLSMTLIQKLVGILLVIVISRPVAKLTPVIILNGQSCERWLPAILQVSHHFTTKIE